MVFEPTIFDKVRRNKRFFTAPIETNSPDTQSRQQLITQLNGVLQSVKRVSAELLVTLFKRTFPKLNVITNKQEGQVNTFSLNPSWRDSGKVCHPVVFDIAFALSIPRDQLPKPDFDTVIADAADDKAFRATINKLQSDGKLVVFLQRLQDYATAGSIPQQSAKNMINVLVDKGDTFIGLKDGDQNIPHLVQRTVHALAKCITLPDERRESLVSAIKNARESLLILLMVAGHREIKSEDTDRIVSDKISQWADEGRLLKHPRIRPILASWQGFGETEKVEHCLQQIRNNETLLLNYLGCFLTEKETSAQGVTAQRTFQMNLNSLKEHLDLEKLTRQLNALRDSSAFDKLAKREEIVVRTFLKEVEQIEEREKKKLGQ